MSNAMHFCITKSRQCENVIEIVWHIYWNCYETNLPFVHMIYSFNSHIKFLPSPIGNVRTGCVTLLHMCCFAIWINYSMKTFQRKIARILLFFFQFNSMSCLAFVFPPCQIARLQITNFCSHFRSAICKHFWRQPALCSDGNEINLNRSQLHFLCR